MVVSNTLMPHNIMMVKHKFLLINEQVEAYRSKDTTHDTGNSFPNGGEIAEQQCVHKRPKQREMHRSIRCSSTTPLLKLKLYIRTQARAACKKKKTTTKKNMAVASTG